MSVLSIDDILIFLTVLYPGFQIKFDFEGDTVFVIFILENPSREIITGTKISFTKKELFCNGHGVIEVCSIIAEKVPKALRKLEATNNLLSL